MQKTSQGSEFQLKYGLLGAGAIATSVIGKLPARASSLGPVSAVSFRVASRIANSLRAGRPVRSPDELDVAPVILFHSPPEHMEQLLGCLESAKIDWTGKSLVFCDCCVDRGMRARLRARGASVASAREFEIPGHLVVEGTGPALTAAHRMARELRLKVIEITADAASAFDAAITLATCALTPLIDRAAMFLREAGVRDMDASRLAATLFQQTAREFAHSGKQSWGWYVKQPEAAHLTAQIAAAGDELGPVFRQLLLFGLDAFEKHPSVAAELREP